MISVTINGERESFSEAPSVQEILERLAVPQSAVAVEVNRRIVPRATHKDYRLADGDEVEVVTFVGGG